MSIDRNFRRRSNPSDSQPRNAVVLAEPLEQRRLLSVSLSSTGIMRISGTSQADVISVYMVRNRTDLLEVKDRGVVSQHNRADVQQIRVYGFGGNDLIQVLNVNGAVKITTKLYGYEGDDTIIGGQTRDRVYGGPGNDSITGSGGHDILYGEDGNDSILGENGKDYIGGGEGDDAIQGNADNDRIFGDAGNDVLSGNAGNDTILGGDGGDTIGGGLGNDLVRGGADGDFVRGDEGNDYVFGDEGNDFVLGGDGDDDLAGGPGTDTVNGLAGNDDYYDPEDAEFDDDAGPNTLPDIDPSTESKGG